MPSLMTKCQAGTKKFGIAYLPRINAPLSSVVRHTPAPFTVKAVLRCADSFPCAPCAAHDPLRSSRRGMRIDAMIELHWRLGADWSERDERQVGYTLGPHQYTERYLDCVSFQEVLTNATASRLLRWRSLRLHALEQTAPLYNKYPESDPIKKRYSAVLLCVFAYTTNGRLLYKSECN